jgi:hypothetical protein
MFDTKIAIVVRDDMPVWQKLNVTAFLMSGIVGSAPDIIGERYVDAAGHSHMGLSVQPVIVLTAQPTVLKDARNRARERSIDTAVYIEEMFATGHDAANRAVFREHGPDEENVVGIALRAEKRVVDRITKGAKMHG